MVLTLSVFVIPKKYSPTDYMSYFSLQDPPALTRPVESSYVLQTTGGSAGEKDKRPVSTTFQSVRSQLESDSHCSHAIYLSIATYRELATRRRSQPIEDEYLRVRSQLICSVCVRGQQCIHVPNSANCTHFRKRSWLEVEVVADSRRPLSRYRTRRHRFPLIAVRMNQ